MRLFQSLHSLRMTSGSGAKQFLNYWRVYVWKSRLPRRLFLISAALVVLTFCLLFVPGWQLRGTGETVALRYNVYFGVDFVGSWSKLFLYPVFALFILLVNFAVSLGLIKKEKLLAQYFIAVTPAILLLNMLTLIFVLALNLEFIER